jgi:LysM repeat protein
VTPTPAASGEATPTPAGETEAPGTDTPAPTEAGPLEYTVQDGDTWYGIAEAYGVDAENLAAVNGLTLDDFLQPGDVIVIPQ